MHQQLVTGQFNDSFAPITDGVAIAVENYARWLCRTLGPAYVITPRGPDPPDGYPFQVVRFFSVPAPRFSPYRLGFYELDPLFRDTLRLIPFDLVHAHCPFSSGRVARHVARQRQVPLVATFHTKYRENLERVLNQRDVTKVVLRYIVDFYAGADQVWVPNQATGLTLRDYGFRGDLVVVPNGSDLETPETERAQLAGEADRALGLPTSEPVLLFVGQHVWEKNVAFLIHALATLRDSGRPFTMLFVGDGYARAEMEQLVAQHSLGDRVRFLGLVRDREALRRLYCRADLFLFPSLYDNAPLAVREAASCGTPSVLIAGCSAADGMTDGSNGFLAEHSVASYAGTVGALLDDDARRQHAALGARQTLFRPWRDIVDEVQWHYRELVTHHAGQRHHPVRTNSRRLRLAPTMLALRGRLLPQRDPGGWRTPPV